MLMGSCPVIVLYAFSNMFPGGIGETKDMRVQWALEEMDIPYEVKPLDYLGGETTTPEFSAISPFNQVPVLDHDGHVIAESGAILIHLADMSGKLTLPGDLGRTRVNQWCFAAAATVAPALSMITMVDAGFMGTDPTARTFLVDLAKRWLTRVERQLEKHSWITGHDFTVADIMLVHHLREIRDTDLLDEFPRTSDVYTRALHRPAWQRTRVLTAERLKVELGAIPPLDLMSEWVGNRHGLSARIATFDHTECRVAATGE